MQSIHLHCYYHIVVTFFLCWIAFGIWLYWSFPDWCFSWVVYSQGRGGAVLDRKPLSPLHPQRHTALWLAGSVSLTDWGPPRVRLSWKPVLFHSSYLKALPGGHRLDIYSPPYMHLRSVLFLPALGFHLVKRQMAGYTGLRSCTWTEFPVDVLANSSLISQSAVGSNCDLTLLTCLLIGSYRFCVAPLLALFNSKDGNRLWRSKRRFNLNMNAMAMVNSLSLKPWTSHSLQHLMLYIVI